jgi:hypothetical protein
MLKILGEQYFIDVDEIENFITLESSMNSSGFTENSISITRYEMIKMMLDTVLTENETIDETLGIKSSGMSISFKFAFNTLLNKNIISKY